MIKKIILGIFLCALCTYAFADWTLYMPIGFSYIDTNMTGDASDFNKVYYEDKNIDDYGAITYYVDTEKDSVNKKVATVRIGLTGVENRWGIVAKGLWDIGVAWSNDFCEKTAVGFDNTIDLGLGWYPLHLERFYLGATALLGANISAFFKNDSYSSNSNQGTYKVRSNKIEENWLLADFHIGFDAEAVFWCSNKIGIYANIGWRTIVGGITNHTLNQTQKWGYYYAVDEKSTKDHETAKFQGTIVTPSIGVACKL